MVYPEVLKAYMARSKFKCAACGQTEMNATPFNDPRPEPHDTLCAPCGAIHVTGSVKICPYCGWAHLAQYQDLGKPPQERFGRQCRRCSRDLHATA